MNPDQQPEDKGPDGGNGIPQNSKKWPTHFVVSVVAGVLYGIVAQISIRKSPFISDVKALYGVMSFIYVFIVPFCLGVMTVMADRETRGWKHWMSAPWVTVTCCFGVALAVGWEGTICILMAAPIFYPMSSLGGLVAGLFQRYRGGMSAILLAPFVLGPLEANYVDLPKEVRTVDTYINIEAVPARVWPEIIRVRPISETQSGLFYRMGFPKPIEATLSKEGVGGVREARFERGLVFFETVTEWVPLKRIRFDIKADPNATPLTTLDPHVVPGGIFFDALEGMYEIQTAPSGPGVRLKLQSRYRISTQFNRYARLWGDYLMRDIQNNILRVIKARAEKK